MVIKEFNFAELHKALWLWLSKHQKDNKAYWPGWKINGGLIPKVQGFCFACHAAKTVACKRCPLQWHGGLICRKPDGLYQGFIKARNKNDKIQLAKNAFKIAHLEWVGEKIFKLEVKEPYINSGFERRSP